MLNFHPMTYECPFPSTRITEDPNINIKSKAKQTPWKNDKDTTHSLDNGVQVTLGELSEVSHLLLFLFCDSLWHIISPFFHLDTYFFLLICGCSFYLKRNLGLIIYMANIFSRFKLNFLHLYFIFATYSYVIFH